MALIFGIMLVTLPLVTASSVSAPAPLSTLVVGKLPLGKVGIKPFLPKNADLGKYQLVLNPTMDGNSETGFYIPRNLSDAVKVLDSTLPSKFKNKFRKNFPKTTSVMKQCIGYCYLLQEGDVENFLVKAWGLNSESRLAIYFRKKHIKLSAYMIDVIMQAYYFHLAGIAIYAPNLLEKIAYKEAFYVESQKNCNNK